MRLKKIGIQIVYSIYSKNKPVIVLKAPNTHLPTNINPIYGPLNFKKLGEATIYVLKELRKLQKKRRNNYMRGIKISLMTYKHTKKLFTDLDTLCSFLDTIKSYGITGIEPMFLEAGEKHGLDISTLA